MFANILLILLTLMLLDLLIRWPVRRKQPVSPQRKINRK